MINLILRLGVLDLRGVASASASPEGDGLEGHESIVGRVRRESPPPAIIRCTAGLGGHASERQRIGFEVGGIRGDASDRVRDGLVLEIVALP